MVFFLIFWPGIPAFEKLFGLKFSSSGEAELETVDDADLLDSPNQDMEMEEMIVEEGEEGKINEAMVRLFSD